MTDQHQDRSGKERGAKTPWRIAYLALIVVLSGCGVPEPNTPPGSSAGGDGAVRFCASGSYVVRAGGHLHLIEGRVTWWSDERTDVLIADDVALDDICPKAKP